MVVKNYKIWENTRGDGVQDEDEMVHSSQNSSKYVISLPSGEVVEVENVKDLKELSDQKLVTYYKNYKGKNLESFCCTDADFSKVKYLIIDFKTKRSRIEKYMNVAKGFRKALKDLTKNVYVITYDKTRTEFTAIMPDLNLFSPKEMKEIEELCIKMSKNFPNYSFEYKTRNYKATGVEFLRTDDY